MNQFGLIGTGRSAILIEEDLPNNTPNKALKEEELRIGPLIQ